MVNCFRMNNHQILVMSFVETYIVYLHSVEIAVRKSLIGEDKFQPLGIQEYQWYEDKKKISKGADGLLLKAEDMMKVGLLVLKKGVYKEKRIVSEDWINHSIKPNLMTYEKIGYYGMHWWVNKQNVTKAFSEDNQYFFALGFGGQYIFIWPKEELVITITGDLYETSLLPLQLIKDHILR
ncbi:hypothetical protein ACFTQ7_15705 [Lysinibacillus sp. NPDC056959]|uniref:hypothetical protein n=1 Tax=Lysinibacillus sp. NPDC056959 TaxID=3345981 RepID=UPI00362ACC0C